MFYHPTYTPCHRYLIAAEAVMPVSPLGPTGIRTGASVICLAFLLHDIVDLAMTHFPQTHPQHRAQRVQFDSTIGVVVKLTDGRSARAKLQTISETGGMLRLPGALEQGNLVEVTIETESGDVKAMAEILQPTRKSKDGILQPFRFIALEDNDHRTLRNALDSRVDKDFLGLRSSQWVAPKRQ
jgi:hypothetical protein